MTIDPTTYSHRQYLYGDRLFPVPVVDPTDEAIAAAAGAAVDFIRSAASVLHGLPGGRAAQFSDSVTAALHQVFDALNAHWDAS